MKQTKKWALAVTVSGMALVLCSCSTAASNANRYFTSVGAIATNLMNSCLLYTSPSPRDCS